MVELSKTEHQQWIRRRADAVRQVYTAYDALIEFGQGEALIDQDTAIQVSCPFHGVDARPSARYYPSSGSRSDYLRCYYCKENWDALNLFMKFRGLQFMDALKELERRYRLKVPKRPDGTPIEEPKDRSSSEYVSEAWLDVPRVLDMLEKKLARVRDRASLIDYVRFCRVLDRVRWDLDLAKGEPTDAMVQILDKLRKAMDALPQTDLGGADAGDGRPG